MRKYLAFDIEIAKLLPEGMENWRSQRPLGITCAATLTFEGDLKLWYGRKSDSQPSDRMTSIEAAELVTYLQQAVDNGFSILTWNGLGFDFDILAEESERRSICIELAMVQFDMMFHLFCLRGHTLGLDKAARGMGVPGKSAGMSGDMAPRYWAEGRHQEVLEYCSQDVRATLGIAQAIEIKKDLKWFSNSGTSQRVPFPQGLLSVNEALKLPLPMVRGFNKPLSRQFFYAWTGNLVK